jgi:N-acetylneuraminic acid mutarotase
MAAGIEAKLYVAGGQISCCDSDFVATLEVYDPETDTWTTKTPMGQARGAGGSAVIDGKLYVVGGRIPGIDVATLEMYDPATNTWTTKTPMPTPRRWPGVEAIGGLLYVAGGTQQGPGPGALSALEVYDPVNNTWTTKASLPAPRATMASGVIDRKLYLAGGLNAAEEIVATLLVYDSDTNTWAEKTPMHAARAYPGGAVLDGQLYVISGIADNESPFLSTMELYDPATDGWRAGAPIPTGRNSLGEVGVIDGRLYVAGGWAGAGHPCFGCDIATLEVFTAIQTPADALRSLAMEIQVLPLRTGEKKSLITKLKAAFNSINRGNQVAACNQLHAFINEIRALVRSDRLDPTIANTLISAARGIKAALACP